MKILICGVRAPIALDLLRAFSKTNVEIHVADTFLPLVIHALYAQFHKYAKPALGFENFEIVALDICNKLKPDLIIALNEEVFYWAKLAKAHNLPLFAPDLSTLMKLHSKLRFIEFAKSIGLHTPKTWVMRGDENPHDLVFKREFSRFGENVLIRPNILPPQNAKNQIIAQEYIEGRDLSFYAIAKNGQLLAFSCYQSDWRTGGGASYYFAKVDEETKNSAQEIAQKIAAKLSVNGQFSCDLRAQNGELYLIECNPRATSGLHLLGDEIANCFIENRPIEAKNTSKYIGLAMLFMGLPHAIARHNLAKFLSDLKRAKNVYENRNILALIDTLRHVFGAFVSGQSLAQYLTLDIECNRDLEIF